MIAIGYSAWRATDLLARAYDSGANFAYRRVIRYVDSRRASS
jgi:hypothetical protein